MSKFFKNGTLYGLKPERKSLIDLIATVFKVQGAPHTDGYHFTEEILADDREIISQIADSPSSQRLIRTLFERGNLDFTAAFTQQYSAENLEPAFHTLSHFSLDELYQDLISSGLHGFHFRMDLDTQAARLDAVSHLSRHLYNLASPASNSDYPFPLAMVSAHIQRDYTAEMPNIMDEIESRYSDDDEGEPVNPFTADELDSLLNLNATWVCPGIDTDSGRSGLEKILDTSHYHHQKAVNPEHSLSTLAECIELSFMAMVYNYGYRLKATLPISDLDLRDQVSPIIEGILELYPASQAFKAGLKRQVLINLFSAFPEGLKLLETSPEELQGVILDPILRDDPNAFYFKKTLAGPLALFAAKQSTMTREAGLLIVDFLSASGYQVNTSTASQGILFNHPEFLPLIHNEEGKSAAIDAYFSRLCPSDRTNGGVVAVMTEAKYLSHASDAAALNIMIRALAEPNFLIEPTADFPGFLKARPHLVGPLVSKMTEHQIDTPHSFQICGFGEKELRMLKQAPDSLMEHVLGSDLGL